MASETFRDSFKPHHLLKPHAICSLKKHYYNVLREVVGYVEILAGNDPERFVFASVPDITNHCNKFSKDRAPYKQRQVENALEFLRTQNVISGRIERQRLGMVRSGFIVTPHDALCVRKKNCCEFKGAGLVPGSRFATMPGAHCWWWIPAEDAAAIPHQVPQHDSSIAATPAVSPAVPPAAIAAVRPAVLNQESCAEGCGEGCGTDSRQATQTQGSYSAAQKVFPTFSESSGAPNRVNHSTVGAELSVGAVDDDSQSARPATSSPKSMNDETIGQHFGGTTPVYASFSSLTEGVLNTDTKQWEDFGIEAQYQLLYLCHEVIREFAAEPYLGRKTNAMLMDAAMKRFNGKHGKVPSSWLKVMSQLREDG